jgi:hypothetical protein
MSDNIFLNQLITFATSDDNTLRIDNVSSSKTRAKIYEKCEELGLIAKSFNYSGSTSKYIVVNKHLNTETFVVETLPTEPVEPVITTDIISFYAKYSSVPIVLHTPNTIKYFVELYDKYYDAQKHWDNLMNDLCTTSLRQLKSHFNDVKANIISFIKASEEFKNMSSMENTLPLKSMRNKTDIYIAANDGKHFISVDVISANYRVLKHFCPVLTEEKEWKEFVSKFTTSKFLIGSKYFREIVFGDLGCKKIGMLPMMFLEKVFNAISSSLFYDDASGGLKLVYCSNDELVYEINNFGNFDFVAFSALINSTYGGYFHIRPFQLKKLGQSTCFVKEFHYIDKNPELKLISKKFIAQCIKFYEHREIDIVDRKFVDESGYVATYDNSIFD